MPRASPSKGMKSFSLQSPIRPALEAILSDYPGGQLLSEALQNAEDSGASEFVLTLDLRHHTDVEDSRLSAPAFVLSDNGSGFTEREWRSIQNLHQSEKANSPRDIGRFGMGSRSYFHYADVTLVVSNGVYCGIDPLNVINVDGREPDRGGWMCEEGVDSAVDVEVSTLFGPFKLRSEADTGATFRLPLRSARDSVTLDGDGGLGPEIQGDSAEKLLHDWAQSLCDGRLLLFLASVKHITVQRWEEGSETPTVLAEVTKTYSTGDPHPRLPTALPDEVTESFAALQAHISSLDGHARAALARPSTSLVTIAVQGSAVTPSTSTWRIVQQFAAHSKSLTNLIRDCKATPMVGVAVPVVSDDQKQQPEAGAAFCFLPIGAIHTGLPVHVNASFQVTKDRRSLWLPGGDNVQGVHALMVKWNEALLFEILPALWLDALVDITQMTSARDPGPVVRCLPDIEIVAANGPDWLPCARTLYRLAADLPILPHIYGETAEWVAPSAAAVLEDPPNPTFAKLRDNLMELYAETAPESTPKIVHVPWHIVTACRDFGQLSNYETSDLLLQLLTSVQPVHLLSPALVALAELGDTPGHSGSWHTSWSTALAKHKWVPLDVAPTYACLDDAFTSQSDADATALHVENFKVVDATTTEVTNCAALRSMKRWGLKHELTWEDVMREAASIASIPTAQRFLKYIDTHVRTIGTAGQSAKAALQHIAQLDIFPSDPTNSHHEHKLWPATEITLMTQGPLVGMVIPTSEADYQGLCQHGLAWRPISDTDVSAQVRKVVSLVETAGLTLERAEKELSTAARYLVEYPSALEKLQDLAWLPSDLSPTELRLLEPARVTLSWTHDLCPDFGLLTTAWQKWWPSGLDGLQVEAAGFSSQLPFSSLLSAVANKEKKEALGPQDVRFAVNLAAELSERCTTDPEGWTEARSTQLCFVPTACRKLAPVETVFINDAAWSSSAGRDEALLLHDKVSHAVGKTLGCTSVRAELAKSCEVEDGGDFGQSEDLDSRIRGLLQEYDGKLDVFSEHWQNSDDAGAETLYFLLDEGSHGTERLIEHCDQLQGPALVLASSQKLTKNDIVRIQRVGNSQKRAEFDKVGHFGVGLTCLYSLTDCPTFLADGSLHVMDPLHLTVARGTSKNGRKFSVERLKKARFRDMLAPFDDDTLSKFPTIFRLPLRKHAVPPATFGAFVSVQSAKDLLNNFASQAEEMLVFAKSVRRAEFAVKKVDGTIETIASVTRLVAPSDTTSLMMSLPRSLAAVNHLLQQPMRQVTRIALDVMSIDHYTYKREWNKREWVVAHAVEADRSILDLVQRQMDDGTAMLPHGAAAVRLGPSKGYKGHMCCYLPLTSMGSVGPPLLLHGCFALSANRKSVSLPVRDMPSTVKQQWNQAIVCGPMASALAALVLHCRDLVDCGTMNAMKLSTWSYLFAVGEKELSQPSIHLRQMVQREVFKQLLSQRVYPIMTIEDKESGPSMKFEGWVDGASPFHRLDAEVLDDRVQNQLIKAGLPLVHLRRCIFEGLVDLGSTLSLLTADRLCSFLRTVALVAEQGLGSLESVKSLVTFIANDAGSAVELIDRLRGLPLLVTADEKLHKFGSKKIYWDKEELLPNCPSLFIHREVRRIITRACESPVALEKEIAKINVHPFNADALLEQRTLVHKEKYHTNVVWRVHAFSLIKQQALSNNVEVGHVADQFHTWCLAKVIPPGQQAAEFVPLSSLPSVFSFLRMDPEYESELGNVLSECSINVLDLSDGDQCEIFGARAANGDADLIRILRAASIDLSAVNITGILEYFCTRVTRKKLNPDDLKEIKRLPLFASTAGFTSIADDDTIYVSVSGARMAEVKALNVLVKVSFIDPPSDEMGNLYRILGIKAISSSEFVADFVCGALAKAAGESCVDNVTDGLSHVMQSLVGELKHWLGDPTVVAEARSVSFVRPANGSAPCRPDQLLDPHASPITSVFSNETARFVPASCWMEHIAFLKSVGLQTCCTIPIIAECAMSLDKESRPKADLDKPLKRRSFELVQEIFRLLNMAYNAHSEGNDSMQLIHAVSDLNIAIVYPPGREALAATLSGDRRRHPELAPLTGLTLTDRAAHLICGSTPGLARYAGKPSDEAPGTVALDAAVKDHADRLYTDLKCICSSKHIGLDVLLVQFRDAARVCVESLESEAGRAPSRWGLLNDMMQEINSNLEASGTQQGEMSLFDILKTTRCLPLEQKSDAAGPLSCGMVSVILVEPHRCFERLSRHALRTSELPLHEHRMMFSKYPILAQVLGMRSEPQKEDWAQCTHIVAARAAGKPAVPNDLAALRVAVHAVLAGEDHTDGNHLDMCLPDAKAIIVSTSELTWADRPELRDRCKDTRFAALDILGLDTNVTFCNRLCNLTGLSRLSECVHETVSKVSVAEPNHEEQLLQELLHSSEFASGIARLMHMQSSSNRSTQDSRFEAHVHKVLATLQVRWATAINTTLQSTPQSDGIDDCSATEKVGFVDDDGVLWLKTNQLAGNKKADELISVLGGRLLPALLSNVGSVSKTHILVRLLKWAATGPAAIAAILECEGIPASTSCGLLQGRAPGRIVPVEDHDTLQWASSLTFNSGEIVAVELDVSTGDSHKTFVYAQVEADQEGARERTARREIGDAVAPTQTNAAVKQGPPAMLLRRYMLNEGGEMPIERKHLEMHKVTRQRIRQAPSADPSLAVQLRAGSTEAEDEPAPHAVLGEMMGPQVWDELMGNLREMVDMDKTDYRKVLKQLWRKWHPDKTNDPLASAIFVLVQRHSTCYETGGDWAWLGALSLDTVDDVTVGRPSGPVPTPQQRQQRSHHSSSDPTTTASSEYSDYFAEFEREEKASQARQQHHSTAKAAWGAATDKPKIDEEMADMFWQLAEREYTVAGIVLGAGSVNLCATIVWHSQQAVEFALKALMLHKCGISETELKGKGAHNVSHFFIKLTAHCDDVCPVDPDAIAKLAKAYIGARYGPNALSGYSKEDAEEAHTVADKVLQWAKQASPAVRRQTFAADSSM
eukprot:m.17763 g.17763  ORF g.17763 m.17763 type:complete len:3009 (+) comp9429_c0_seq1:126-9152(+)